MTATALTPAPPFVVGRPRAGALTDAWRQTGLLVRWQLHRLAEAVPLLVMVQILLSVATIAGYGLLVGDPTRAEGLYLATGAPTVALVMVGLVMTPQLVAQARTEGSLDWLRTLPVPRGLFLLADLLVWTVIALPGVVLGVIAGSMRFHVDLAPTWWLVPAALLVSLTAAAIGYAIATLAVPSVAQLLSQVFVFVVLLFSPVSFPAERMPVWAQHLHEWLPFEAMAQAMRGGLASHDFTMPVRSWLVLGAWCVASVSGALVALRRRG